MIPGSNLLRLAIGVIGAQTVMWSHATGRTNNIIGLLVTTYADPVAVTGSFQPVPRALIETLGLDFNKEYVTFFTTTSFQDIGRDDAPDKFVFDGSTYQVLNNTEWMAVDGWNSSIAVKITS